MRVPSGCSAAAAAASRRGWAGPRPAPFTPATGLRGQHRVERWTIGLTCYETTSFGVINEPTRRDMYDMYYLYSTYVRKWREKPKIEELLLNFVIVSLFWFSRLPSTTPHLPLSPVLAVPVRSTKIKKKSHTHLWEYCQQRACTLDGPPRLSPLKEDQANPNTEIKPERQDVYC